MADREKKQGDGEEDSDEKNHPLSREGWINLLTCEINRVEMKLATYWNAGLIILIALLGVGVAALVASLQSDVTSIEDNIYKILAWALVICEIVIVIAYYGYYRPRYQRRVERLGDMREKIISGKIDFSEIHKEWEIYIKKYYGKLLEKLEMNEANEEEKSKEVDSGKSIE